jgi:hypothetical protein
MAIEYYYIFINFFNKSILPYRLFPIQSFLSFESHLYSSTLINSPKQILLMEIDSFLKSAVVIDNVSLSINLGKRLHESRV